MICRKFHLTFADDAEQEELAEAVAKTTGIINPFCLGEFPYHEIPSPDDDNGAVVFPIKDLHLHRNDFDIPIPEVEVTLENVRSLYSITKGPFAIVRLVLISSNFQNIFSYFCPLLEPSNSYQPSGKERFLLDGMMYQMFLLFWEIAKPTLRTRKSL